MQKRVRDKKKKGSTVTYKGKDKAARTNVRSKGKKDQVRRESNLEGNLKKARLIGEAEGQRGVDPRASGLSPTNALGNLALTQLDHSVDVIGAVESRVISMLALGPVLSAIKRGWLSQRSSSSGLLGAQVAYNAWVFLTQSFLSASQGVYPTIQAAPEWFWQICDAIKPKVVPFKTADVSYKMRITSGLDYVPSSIVDYGTTPSSLIFGIPDPADLVNGMPVLTPVAYNSGAASESIQSMFDVFPESLMCKRTGAAQLPYLVQDASAYAGSYSELGYDLGAVGGLASSLTSEAHINSPILAKLCQYNDSRGYIEERRSAGSAVYTIPRVMEFTEYNQFHNKSPPIFKFYNFDRYFQILSLAVARALQLLNASMLGVPPTICPLTSLQVQILLRQAILPIFSNEMAQDLVSQDQNSMVAFSVLSNGYAPAGSDMLLPSFLVEAIRTAARKTIQVSKDYKNYQLDYVPVLSRSPDVFQLQNFQWSAGNNVYSEDVLEIPVDLIDMKATVPIRGPVFLQPTCGVNFERLEEWNQFMHQLEAAFAGLSTIGTEKGISCLSSVFFSDFTSYNANVDQPVANPAPSQGRPPLHPTKSVSKKSLREVGTPRKMKLKSSPTPGPGSEYYQGVNIIATSTSIAENGPEWKYQRVIPHAYNQGWSEPDSFMSKRQVFNHEGYKINHTTEGLYDGAAGDLANLGLTVYNLDLAASSYCVRGQLSAESEVERDIRVMGESGRGGFLSNIAGLLAENVFGISGARKVAGQIGELTGL